MESTEITEAKVIIDNPDYQFVESVHTTKGTSLFVLRLKSKIEDKFKLVSKRVNKRGGYWSGHQRGFVFKRVLSQEELNEIFKGVFFEEKIDVQEVDVNKDAWMYSIDELKSLPSSQREDGTFVFKYLAEGKPTTYSVKVPSANIDDAVRMFAKQVIGNALLNNNYNMAVSKGEMTPIRAAHILKGLGLSLFELEEDYGEVNPEIRAVYNMKQATKEQTLDKLKYPFLFERNEMLHLSDERYSQFIYNALSEGKYDKLIKDGVISANKAAFVIESAGFEIPDDILSEAIYERKKEVENLIGGFADSQSIFDIADKHGVPVKEIIKQFRKGIRVEREHTKDKRKMGEIVKDHLTENPYYYDVLLIAEKAMESVNHADYKTHEEYLAAVSEKEKQRAEIPDDEKAFLIARPTIDRIKQLKKQIEAGVPEETETFLRNEILNQFVVLFNNVVSEFIFFTPVWLDMQVEYLTEQQRKEMLMFGVFNKAFYDEKYALQFVDNVINSEIVFGKEKKELNNIFDLLPASFSESVPSELEYELNPKNKNLATILDSFVTKGKVLSSTMGVYFTKDGVFASKINTDIFIRGKKGYLKKLNIEEGVYGLSEVSKDIFPTYGVKRLSINRDSKTVSFFGKYMATYGNEKKKFKKPETTLVNDEVKNLYKDLSVVYNSRAFKQYFRRDIINFNPLENVQSASLKFKVTDYPMLYIKQGDSLFVVSFNDMMDALKTMIQMDSDSIQIGASESGLYISENISSFLEFEETGIRVKVRSVETEMPHGLLYFDLKKKSFYTNKLVPKVSEEKSVESKSETSEEVKAPLSVDDLNIRISVIKKMIAKNPSNKSDLEVRIKVIEKLIAKISEKKMREGGLFNADGKQEVKIERKALVLPDKPTLKKVVVNNNAWYLDPVRMIVYENENTEGSSIPVAQMSSQERAQVYDQMLYEQPMISHKTGGELLPDHIVDDINGTGYSVVSVHPHGSLHIIKLKKHSDLNWDAKDFSRFKWVVDNHESNNNQDEFSVKAKFGSGGDMGEERIIKKTVSYSKFKENGIDIFKYLRKESGDNPHIFTQMNEVTSRVDKDRDYLIPILKKHYPELLLLKGYDADMVEQLSLYLFSCFIFSKFGSPNEYSKNECEKELSHNFRRTYEGYKKYKKGGDVSGDYDPEKDLFLKYETLPDDVKAILDKYSEEDATYESLAAMTNELEPLGYTFDYYLDAEPYNLRKITMANGGAVEGEYKYAMTIRPFGIGTYPNKPEYGFLRWEEGKNNYGVLVYSKPLSEYEIDHASLEPITETIPFDGKQVFHYEDYKANIKIVYNKSGVPYVEVEMLDENGEIIDKETISSSDFLKKIKSGTYRAVN